MSKEIYRTVPAAALSGSMRDFRVPKGTDLLAQVSGCYQWQDLRRQNGVWPYSRSTQAGPTAYCAAQDDRGLPMTGVNFASQDYLSLSSHEEIKATAADAVHNYGVHSGGSAALVGNTAHSVLLERRIADFLNMEEAVWFPTG